MQDHTYSLLGQCSRMHKSVISRPAYCRSVMTILQALPLMKCSGAAGASSFFGQTAASASGERLYYAGEGLLMFQEVLLLMVPSSQQSVEWLNAGSWGVACGITADAAPLNYMHCLLSKSLTVSLKCNAETWIEMALWQ